MSESFTNRRGHSLSVEQEQAANITAVVTESTPNQPKKVLAIRQRRRPSVHLPWKWIGVVVGGGIVIALVTLEIVRFSYLSSVNSAQQRVAEIVANDVADAMKQSPLTSATISSLGDSFKAVSMSLCPGGLLDNYATLYPRSRQALDECTAYRSNVESLVTALTTLAGETNYLEGLQPLLGPIAQPLTDQFAVLASQRENWSSVLEGAKDLTPPVAFQAAHGVFVQRVEAVTSVWIELVSASNDQDSARFSAATAKLNDLYAAVRASAEEFETALGNSQTALTSAYAALK